MSLKIICKKQIRLLFLKKIISVATIFSLFISTFNFSYASSILSDDKRYEMFNGNNITIDDILEKDEVDIEIEGNTLVNLAEQSTVIIGENLFSVDWLRENWNNRTGSSNSHLVSRLIQPIKLKPNTRYLVKSNCHSMLNGSRYSSVFIGNMESSPAISGSSGLYEDGLYITTNDTGYLYLMIRDVAQAGYDLLPTLNDFINNKYWISIIESSSIVNMKYLYPDTEYLVQFNSDINTSSTVALGGAVLSNQAIIKGLNKLNITTPSKITENKLTLSNENINFTNLIVTNSNEEVEYFEEMQSVGELNPLKIMSSNSDNTLNDSRLLNTGTLRGIQNGAKDRIIKKDGKWVVERNLGEVVLNGSEMWNLYTQGVNSDYLCFYSSDNFGSKRVAETLSDKFIQDRDIWQDSVFNEGLYIGDTTHAVFIKIAKSKLSSENVSSFKDWLKNNPVNLVYELETPIYEPISVDSVLSLYEGTTYIANNSIIPVNMKVMVDRVVNRAMEFNEIAKSNPTIENISQARYWINQLDESILKDELENNINDIFNIKDLVIEKKSMSVNTDVYIKMENILQLSLDTNSIVFEDFSSTVDMEKPSAVNLTIKSSLPYTLNAYLKDEIYNNNKSETMDKSVLSIKSNSNDTYKSFIDLNTPILLLEEQDCIETKTVGIDFKLSGGLAHKADVYKTTLKFEVIQK